MFPHLHVHGRNSKDRFIGGEDERGRKIIGNAGRHLGKQVRCGRANDHEIGFATELDMAHFHLLLEVEKRCINLALTKSGQRHRRNELLAALRQYTGDGAASLADQADELAGFVSCNAATDDEQDSRPAHARRSCACIMSVRCHSNRRMHSHKAIDALASAPRTSMPAFSTGVFQYSP